MKMTTTMKACFLALATLVALFSPISAIATTTFHDQTHHTPTTPSGTGSNKCSPGGHHHGASSSPPSTGCDCPPHGGGSGSHDPTTPSVSPPSGGHHGGGGSIPSVSPPSGHHGGGGYYNSPPTYTPTPSTPTTPSPIVNPPIDPGTPSTPTPSTPFPSYSPPSSPGGTITPPFSYTPPSTPSPFDPNTPPAIGGSPPFGFIPSSPPFPCSFWSSNPAMVFGLVGWNGNDVHSMFGSFSFPGGLRTNMNLMEALSNTRKDGYGELMREGTAAMLNSMASKSFPYTTQQVRDSFGRAALSSNKAAAAQARLFKVANEAHLKP